MTIQELGEYDCNNLRSTFTQWNIYMTNGKESLLEIQTKDILSIDINKIAKIVISEKAYILVQKMTGTTLKGFLRDKTRLRELYKNHIFMIMHRGNWPLFYNVNSQRIYYCKRIRAYEEEKEDGKKVYYPGKQVDDGGHFEWFIHETRYLWPDETMDHHEYYIILSHGSNRFDGTNRFVETQELKGDEYKMRCTQKDILFRIANFYKCPIKKHASTNGDFWALFANSIIIVIVLLFYYYKN